MKAIKMKITIVLSWMLVTGVFAASPWSDYKRVPGVTYADQPVGIELSVYLATWPSLEPDIQRLRASQRNAVKADLQKRATSKNNSDGELNLLAQLQREDGTLDEADNTIKAAIALRPDPLTFFAASLVLASIALLANLIPALRATRLDPITTLRYE